MTQLPPQRARDALRGDPEQLVARLSLDLERTISFAEECRWRFPELSAEADHLAEGAMALFGKTIRSLREASASHSGTVLYGDSDGPIGPCRGERSRGTMPT